jgi:predicted phosphodiesterase
MISCFKGMIRIQYISDIHLEFYTGDVNGREISRVIQNTGADVLVLAGDIGKPHLPIMGQS